ncbi:MAG: hypothetical protein KGL39_34010 [Patescibacteria group bacterium]|nr:hypothetical protein [Patescibacteria group bacterium]
MRSMLRLWLGTLLSLVVTVACAQSLDGPILPHTQSQGGYIQAFKASGFAMKQGPAQFVRFMLVGPGGKGGAGTTCSGECGGGGGGGGGGGLVVTPWLAWADLQVTACSVTVAAYRVTTQVQCGSLSLYACYGGDGSAGVNSATNVQGGGGGGVASNAYSLLICPGGDGLQGSSSTNSGGFFGGSGVPNGGGQPSTCCGSGSIWYDGGGAGGANGATGFNNTVEGYAKSAPSGGGGGGGCDSSSILGAPGDIPIMTFGPLNNTALTGPYASAYSTATPQFGFMPGGGGFGGSPAKSSSNATSGGNGGFPGGGGGGGGAICGSGTGTIGNGGNGGGGLVLVEQR